MNKKIHIPPPSFNEDPALTAARLEFEKARMCCAEEMRNLADKIENGKIMRVVIIADDGENQYSGIYGIPASLVTYLGMLDLFKYQLASGQTVTKEFPPQQPKNPPKEPI